MHASYCIVYAVHVVTFQMVGPATYIPRDLLVAAEDLVVCMSPCWAYNQWQFLIGPEMHFPLLCLHMQHLGGCALSSL